MNDRLRSEALDYIEWLRGLGYSDAYIDATYLSKSRRLSASEFSVLLEATP